MAVSTHSRPKAAGQSLVNAIMAKLVSTHSRPKAAGGEADIYQAAADVSTHSRPKAAGSGDCPIPDSCCCFNTQPPEGGWRYRWRLYVRLVRFNTQPPEGGWAGECLAAGQRPLVSTHSRPKAAGKASHARLPGSICFNTQPPEGGWVVTWMDWARLDCFNTQPPEGGWPALKLAHQFVLPVSTHSRPKAAGNHEPSSRHKRLFQHTAARRRLVYADDGTAMALEFQHTAARRRLG